MTDELTWSGRVGAIHSARFFARAANAIKIFTCGEERFPMGQWQAKGLLDLMFFIVAIYGRYWFACPVTADAPFLTLSLWKDLQRWRNRDPALAATLLRTLDRHTWYLSGRHVVFALFSRLVDDETKRKIAEALLLPENEPCEVPLGKPDLPPIFPESTLESFVTAESWFLFKVSS